ncbi:phosphate acyltransferase [Acetohalobium arabaticum]|uniref:Phosphate butyryltransferase n=1 Tax=Acetohalobium arabaticum (strain ATCC 49924 / DSM 5501 / Z-7288) TaxID=574087 RepID=D9QUT9_ACEAZ|nr:phosphate acyltransferase [Acetohalobium arabaticum]ADL11998.1 Phosphate butyryltransferase [Acetohalobium arabaticum DSM 5501]
MAIKTFEELKEAVVKLEPIRVAVAAAGDEKVVGGVKLAQELGIIKEPVLTGDAEKIKEIVDAQEAEVTADNIRDAVDDSQAARLAVKAVNDGEVQALAKGRLETLHYLRAILDKETGIRAAKVLNNLTLFEMDSYHKLVGVSDNAIMPNPDLEDKKAIIENTKPLWTALGIEQPKAAVLAAVEIVNDKMQATVDGCCLTRMVDRGQIKDFIVDGPLSYDIAMSLECAKGKNLADSKVAGDPDLLVLPNLESANMLGKSYKLHGKAESGGLVFGAEVPVMLNSRSDSAERRLNAILMARAIAEKTSLV